MFIIVHRKTMKRTKVDGKFIPVFEYPAQALKYIENRLGNNPNLTIMRCKPYGRSHN